MDYSLHMAVTDLGPETVRRRLREMEEMVAEGITSFKLFMAYPNVLMIDDGLMFQGDAEGCGAERAVLHPCGEWQRDRCGGGADDCGGQDRAALSCAVRGAPKAEAEATHRAIALADMAGARCISCIFRMRTALAELKHAQERGLRALAETCTQYLVLSIEDQMPGKSLGGGEVCVYASAAGEEEPGAAVGGAGGWVAVRWFRRTIARSGLRIRRRWARMTFARFRMAGRGLRTGCRFLWHFGVNAGRITPERFVELTATDAGEDLWDGDEKGAIAPGFGCGYSAVGPEGGVHDLGGDAVR